MAVDEVRLANLVSGVIAVRAGPRHVGASGRIRIWRHFKLLFIKYLFNLYLVGGGARRN